MTRRPSWATRQPREVRDTLFMLALIGWTVAPHLLRLPLWVGALCAGVLAWRGLLAWRQTALPSRWSLVAVLVLAAGLTWWSERTLVGKQAGVTLLVILMALKTLELRARRDALVVFFLGFFLVLTQFLYSQSLLTAVAMGLSVWGWLTALTLAHMPDGQPRLRDASRLAFQAAAIGTPVMVALFLLFPRIGPLWGMPGDKARTGLSEQLELGDVTELAQDDSVAFRLRFDHGAPPSAQLYFRGPVLTDYDGKQWRATHPKLLLGQAQSPQARPNSATLAYEITLEPLRVPWLPLLEHTLSLPTDLPPVTAWPSSPDANGQWRLNAPMGQRLRLQATATLNARVGQGSQRAVLRQQTALPQGAHPRTRAWAQTFSDDNFPAGASADTVARALLSHIRNSDFRYTLTPGPSTGDPVDDFWLDRRSGFCEHYAVSTTIILRELGIPARVVTGYQGLDPLPTDGYYIVRQSNAHAWVEYWAGDRLGWMRLDPTAAVAPERVDRGQALRPPPGLVGGAMDAVSPGLRQKVQRWLESIDNRWNQWVMGYGAQQQLNLLDRLGLDHTDWGSLGRLLGSLVGLVAGLGALWAWWDGRRRSPWHQVQDEVIQRLARRGITLHRSQTGRAWARAVTAQAGPPAQALADWLEQLDTLRYGAPHGQPPDARQYRLWRQEFRRRLTAWPRQDTQGLSQPALSSSP